MRQTIWTLLSWYIPWQLTYDYRTAKSLKEAYSSKKIKPHRCCLHNLQTAICSRDCGLTQPSLELLHLHLRPLAAVMCTTLLCNRVLTAGIERFTYVFLLVEHGLGLFMSTEQSVDATNTIWIQQWPEGEYLFTKSQRLWKVSEWMVKKNIYIIDVKIQKRRNTLLKWRQFTANVQVAKNKKLWFEGSIHSLSTLSFVRAWRTPGCCCDGWRNSPRHADSLDKNLLGVSAALTFACLCSLLQSVSVCVCLTRGKSLPLIVFAFVLVATDACLKITPGNTFFSTPSARMSGPAANERECVNVKCSSEGKKSC